MIDRQTDRQTDFLYQYQYSTAVLTCDKEPSDLCWTMQHLSAACAALSTTSTGNQMAYVTYAFFYNFRYMMYNSNMLCRFFCFHWPVHTDSALIILMMTPHTISTSYVTHIQTSTCTVIDWQTSANTRIVLLSTDYNAAKTYYGAFSWSSVG